MSPLRALCVKGDCGACKCMSLRQIYTKLRRGVCGCRKCETAVEITGVVCAGAYRSTKESPPHGRDGHWSPGGIRTCYLRGYSRKSQAETSLVHLCVATTHHRAHAQ